ncbi:MAG: ATP synthase F1 subunit gamma [Candidatus Pacebacteria bacterium RIFOXYB1_FULL_39_46]|nr:MAG: ATP synthase F1 subunit gamma [Candidatus Pacebacteria bacterium RIFOXYB1_FULL_39_46]OGJ39301.1 MAG: ATP synthase F1 subunit gamma [Candidatus Pacebacteria bacterium RIFOXYA1_FULL_38_18]OGJ40981.1 MAG: ATP synthase F1 subunit gamma [Candidatus Pacebacteria bacterium RIFOXYD1_FULL_39_27]OGJ41162.1 MAG: ATP synthase F1 subunit gamma [Candidatus Pacebacteria bacterium RIFOXYC1_FULL_39_21]
MSNEQQIKRRISTAQNIAQITKAMEMVAASKMKKAQDQALAARDYSQALNESIATLFRASKPSHPLLSNHELGLPIMLVISTDKGLCGALNANLARELLIWKKQHSDGEVICVGKKAVLLTRKLELTVHAQFTDLSEYVSFQDVIPVIELIIKGFLEQQFCSVEVLYTDFINTLSQKPKLETILPISKNFELETEKEIKTEVVQLKEYLFEPSPQAILDQLLPFYLENMLFHIFLEAKASEHSARMVAMKNASENAKDLMGELRLIYNKSRQQNVTSELLDIISATMALN